MYDFYHLLSRILWVFCLLSQLSTLIIYHHDCAAMNPLRSFLHFIFMSFCTLISIYFFRRCNNCAFFSGVTLELSSSICSNFLHTAMSSYCSHQSLCFPACSVYQLSLLPSLPSSSSLLLRLFPLNTTSHILQISFLYYFYSFQGHVNSVECVAYWASQHMVLSGDWSGNIFGWSVRGLESGDAAADVSTNSKKKQKGEKGAVNSSSSVRWEEW